MTIRDERRPWTHTTAADEDERLRARRDLARQEIGETIEALTRKADLSSRAQEAAHDYLARVQESAADMAGHARGDKGTRTAVWLSLLALAGVATASYIALSRARRATRPPLFRL
ncbi:acyl-CoA reductase-like NAD-dependent aldehyde dehydrogenase [Actinopolyspora biskrensis]|uniref:Acyl-CoA reductase-like NAD-dependent aldehyde dehydrogenase n=1 Tax=Actinopolyspora biskrensis TaxID=1470178 RepID=A0A852YUX8_9ACTN|nr:hypothetical protein [Actinopolyspora biskrensis]NYH77808.1 acyl-CoA reductase-like NAD-dependent aldehyde dehydrogenase [Actinopolyspora biskrensis]